jgi:hypothetical protein
MPAVISVVEKMSLINKTIETYKEFLMVKYPSHFRPFCRRLNSKPESAKAEAVTFSLFRSVTEDVKVAEDVATGGADFLCLVDNTDFIVEVTCLEGEAVAGQSGWPNEVPKGASAGSFGMITHMLRTKASKKAPQLSCYQMPRVLAITSEHHAHALLGPPAAETLLTSDTKITVPIGQHIDENVHLTTDLKDSVFFKFKNGDIESCRKSISAILLIDISADRSLVVGILHPDPQHEFPISFLPSVPFLKMKEWPPENYSIETEWVIHTPQPARFFHQEVVLRDKELRCI